MKKQMLGVAAAVAMTLGVAGSASAFSFGSIPTGATNDGLVPIYGSSPRAGYFGANVWLTGTANLKIEFFGREAGFNNKFIWAGNQLFQNSDVTNNTWNNNGTQFANFSGVSGGLLNFSFLSPLGSAANGANPDDTLPTTLVNFFATFYDDVTGVKGDAQSGRVLDLWLDDGGADEDDNHDDMMIRLTVTGGDLQVVPIPAALPLLLSGLAGLGFIGRRRKTVTA